MPQLAPALRRILLKFRVAGQILAAKTVETGCKVKLTTDDPGRMKMMKKERRWMKSVIAASSEVQTTLPWARGTRRRPEALKAGTKPATQAMAAR